MKLFNRIEDFYFEYSEWDDSVSDAFDDFYGARQIIKWNVCETREFIREGFFEVAADCSSYVLSIVNGDTFSSKAILGDILLLLVQMQYAKKANNVQKDILENVNENNYLELSRFADFCWNYYYSLESELQERQSVFYHNTERGFCDCFSLEKVEDISKSYQVFSEFYQEQLKSIKNTEVVEKSKKM